MIDTHTHLYFDWYDEDRKKVYERMIESGVKATISVGVDAETCRQVYAQTQEYQFIYGACGIHPNDSHTSKQEDIELIESMILENSKIIAVGEVGLDFYRDYAEKDIQKSMFRQMINLARRTKKPLIIHNREADEEVYRILKEENAADIGGVFHCFAGDIAMAKKVLDMNFFISFTGNVTFKNFRQRDVVEYVPLEKLLLETDSPFLTPVPYRGKRNEPAYLQYVAKGLAEIKQIPLQKIIDQTNINAFNLFGIKI